MTRIFLERRGFGEDARQIFEMLGVDPADVTGECTPPLDVVETDAAVEVTVDLPGVAADQIQIVFGRGSLVVGGRKLAPGCEQRDAAFHLAERGFGRFARAVRLSGAFDAGRATATLTAGELHIVLPRIDERRGREIRISVTAQ